MRELIKEALREALREAFRFNLRLHLRAPQRQKEVYETISKPSPSPERSGKEPVSTVKMRAAMPPAS